MLKRIPKSDISVRPFKAYKEWSFDESSFPVSNVLEINERVAIYSASYDALDTTYVTMSYTSSDYPDGNIYRYYPKSIYGQLRAQYYNGNEDNPFLRFGNKTNEYNPNPVSKERNLGNDAKVISIPQIYVGEGIKKGSVSILDTDASMVDDSYGNILLLGNDIINFQSFNSNDEFYTFTLNGTPYTVRITNEGIDIETQLVMWYYDSTLYTARIISFDINSGDMVVDNVDFATAADSVQKVGNVFYNSGLIVMTKRSDERLLSNWELSFKSTQTIYEHEYLLIVNEDEFNVSQNPSAVVEIGRETSFITGSDNKIYRVTTNPGVKYIRKKSVLENGSTLDYSIGSNREGYEHISGGFDQYEYSSSLDSTGSYLAPFITTIGLYDDNCDLVAVAKLPQPIKSYPDLPVNFIVRFDT
jgi:hypothetical protein